MARSRYAGTAVHDNLAYGTWRDPTAESFLGPDILDGLTTVEHVVQLGERLDTLAAKYYSDDEYWWIIAITNRIVFPIGLTPGTKLMIPLDVKMVLSKLQR